MAKNDRKMTKQKCPYCGEEKFLVREFYGSESLLYSENKRHIVCKDCMNTRFGCFLVKCDGDEILALRRTCDNFDIIFDNDIVKKIEGMEGSMFVNYMKKLNANSTLRSSSALDSPMFEEMHSKPKLEDVKVDESVTLKWGEGFTRSEYQQLEYWYGEYLDEYKPKDLSTKKILKDLCMTELLRERARRREDDKAYDMYSKLLSKSRADANIQPSQNKNEDSDKFIFGMMMKIYETKRPVIKRLKEYADVDWIEKYINRFLFKPLAIALGFGSANYTLDGGDSEIRLDPKLEQALANMEEEDREERMKMKERGDK